MVKRGSCIRTGRTYKAYQEEYNAVEAVHRVTFESRYLEIKGYSINKYAICESGDVLFCTER